MVLAAQFHQYPKPPLTKEAIGAGTGLGWELARWCPGGFPLLQWDWRSLGSSTGRREVTCLASLARPGAPSPGEAAPELLPVADGHTARGASR